MTEAFASAVAVTVPILALAAGAEARAVRERVREPDEEWERAFAAYQQEHQFDPDQPHADALDFLIRMPGVPKAFMVKRILAFAGAFIWLVVFVLLAVTELLSLVWLGDGARGTDQATAVFSVVAVALALAALIISPAAYLLFPVLFPLDLVPKGLRKAVGPKLVTAGGRDLLRHMARSFEDAVEHAAQEARDAAAGRAGGDQGSADGADEAAG